ncbi:MAG TPA: alpha/beta fold hydrolase [Candidatus Paceibacterota bacterium]
MTIDFVRFKATDGVGLQGWFTEAPGDTAVIYVHGMSGNGYENYFLDNLRNLYLESGISFFAFDNRGRGIISSFRKGNRVDEWGEGEKLGGSCFELFEESIHDIQGAINFVKAKGKSKFVLQGHSLGGSKVVNYLLRTEQKDILGALLLAPTDMCAWAEIDPRHEEYLSRAEKLLSENKPQELVGSACWLDQTPISAQTYPTISKRNTSVDIYSPREDEPLVSRVSVPMIIIYGDQDIGIQNINGTIDNWRNEIANIINKNTSVEIIQGANHGFAGHEHQLVEIARRYLQNILP